MPTTMPEKIANDNHDTEAALAAAFTRAVTARVGARAGFAEREAEALRLGNEVILCDLKGALERLVEEHGEDELVIDGESYRHHAHGSAEVHSLAGTFEVTRPSYRKMGEHNGPIVVPLDLAAGLMERATPAMAARVAHGHGERGSRALEDQLIASGRVPPSRTTLETIGKKVGTGLAEETRRVSAVVRRSETVPEGTRILQLGLDRTAVRMEEDAPAGTLPKPRTKPRERKAPPPVVAKFRMAYIATLAYVDGDRDVLRTLKYSATPDDGPAEGLRAMMLDVRQALRQDPSLEVLVVQDAAPEMWNRVREALQAEPSVTDHHEVIDWYHAMPHLYAAAEAIDDDTDAIMERWKTMLAERDDAVDDIETEVAHEMAQGYVPERRIVLEDEHTYLTNNMDRLRYASLRARGFPIGSGPTEGAAKSVVACRCKRSGQRWRPPGLRAVLASRDALLNGRLPQAVEALRRHRYTAEIRRAA
jgi:hypothetical protein